jgi:hypothetical protein
VENTKEERGEVAGLSERARPEWGYEASPEQSLNFRTG